MDDSAKIELHKELCKELTEIYRNKNNAYGNAFAVLRKEIPNAVLVRIFDKYSRLKNLLNQSQDNIKQQLKEESIEDTLKDLANYCLMELIERKNKPYKPKQTFIDTSTHLSIT